MRLITLLFLVAGFRLPAQPPTLATSQLGFAPSSPKTVTLIPYPGTEARYPDSLPFYIIPSGSRLPRENLQKDIPAWAKSVYGFPFDLMEGRHPAGLEHNEKAYAFKGYLKKISSRWGTVWQGDFTGFNKKGAWQIETEPEFTPPFSIEDRPYERLLRSYLSYIYSQRSGMDIPGIRQANHLDDAVFDSTGQYIPVTGGWYDAGDYRKWLSFTQYNLEALAGILQFGPAAFQSQALDEIRWGNRYFQAMISPGGRVYEDVAGGDLRGGFTYDQGWWFENHPGCIANNAGNYETDNRPGTGDERKIRMHYNEWVQFSFVRTQALIARVLPAAEAAHSMFLAEKAWNYGRRQGHDRRTLFVAGELLAALELYSSGSVAVKPADIAALAEELLNRQESGRTDGLTRYFLEKGGADAYRSIAFSVEPPMALLRLIELNLAGQEKLRARAREAVAGYMDDYLLKDARSNPFRLTPYGVFINPPHPEAQAFRPAGAGRGVRSFMPPFNDQFLVHGTTGTVMSQAYLCARAGWLLQRPDWKQAAERLIQWATGHNPTGLSLFTGIGYRIPVAFTMHNAKIPDAAINGFAGRPDDTPFLETRNIAQWNTQEVWDVPFYQAVGAVLYLGR